MGYSRGPSKDTYTEVSSIGKRRHRQGVDESEIELEHGTYWKDSPSRLEGRNNCYSAAANGEPTLNLSGSTEDLRVSQRNGGADGGIWKSTNVTVSHAKNDYQLSVYASKMES